MASKMLPLLSLALLAAASPAATAAVFDVPKILGEKAQYSTFLKLLVQTKVVEEIAPLKSVSLLVLPDKAIHSVAALPADKQRLVVANHVLLKYFDPIKLDETEPPTATIATLLSKTDKRLGVLNYTKAHDGQMYFASPGAATPAAKLVKVVAARPYALSIMEVSKPIFPAGVAPAATIAGRRPNGGKHAKIKMSSSAHSEEPKKASTTAGEAASKTSSAEAPTPSPAPKV